MTVYRYQAVAMAGAARGQRTAGEISGESPADVRASLRRVGWQVIEMRAVSHQRPRPELALLIGPLKEQIHRHRRRRRRSQISDFFDSLATMLESGLSLLVALETIQRTGSGHRHRHTMVAELREAVRNGEPLADAMDRLRSWFDPIEIAMVRAGYHAGDLATVLRQLAERHERSDHLNQKLMAALSYPSVIATVGLIVVVFLSNRTLPDLVRTLADAGIEPPRLTSAMITIGQTVLHGWLWLALALVLLPVFALLASPLLRRSERLQTWIAYIGVRLRPAFLRRLAVAHLARRLAELVRCGIPLVEAFQIVIPTTPIGLRRELELAIRAIQRGDELADALDDERWFDAEFRQLLSIGQASGELDVLLERLADRTTRHTARLIDRFTALLEPAVILALAGLIGVVVMAAILPLVRLQEIL